MQWDSVGEQADPKISKSIHSLIFWQKLFIVASKKSFETEEIVFISVDEFFFELIYFIQRAN